MASSSATQPPAASALAVSVTWDDLNAFHTEHFEDKEQQEPEHDSGITYYADGVERTLTDEEIAIFRHSELQQLIRQHRLAQENEDASDSPEDHDMKKFRPPASPHNKKPVSAPVSAQSKGQQKSSLVAKADTNPGLPLKRGQKRVYKPEKQDKQQYTRESDERTFRRICREADEVKDDTIELDY